MDVNELYEELFRRLKTSVLEEYLEESRDVPNLNILDFIHNWQKTHFLSPFRQRIRRWINKKLKYKLFDY